jgi:hypothetical protein
MLYIQSVFFISALVRSYKAAELTQSHPLLVCGRHYLGSLTTPPCQVADNAYVRVS